MPLSRLVRLVVLGMLVLVLGTIVYLRGFGWRLGASPAPLEGPYATEEEWIVGEIVRDITEMSAYPAKLRTEPDVAPVSDGRGRYLVTLTPGATSLDLDLREDLWNPAAFAGVARSALSSQPDTGPGDASSFPVVHPALLNLTPAVLIDTSRSVSRALAGNMRNVRAHEAAALVLGAFALRDSAARSSDTRWAMNRMTAHLAIARSLENNARGIDGDLADATLLTLAKHQRRAMTALDELSLRSSAVNAWTSALRVRTTEDWQLLTDPRRASLLEKREYFKARRATVPSIKPTIELASIGEKPDVNWVRIMESSSLGVEDGRLLEDALDRERAEYKEAYRRMFGRDMAWFSDAMNAPAPRLIGDNGPEVLPWGAWAEFAQRHLSMLVGRADAYYRHMLGSDSAADHEKRRLKEELGDLWMFPSSTAWWTKGPSGGEADFTFINQAVDRAVEAPHRVPAMAWSFIETGTKFEPVRRGLPPPRDWFVRPSPGNVRAASRVKYSGHPRNLADIEAMRKEAPYDYSLAGEYLTSKYGDHATGEQMLEAYGARWNYDVRVIRAVSRLVKDDTLRANMLARSCALAAFECVSLARDLAARKRDAEAAAAYERAFADPSVDAVAVANNSAWLVSYYYRASQVAKALAQAERAAMTGASDGMYTAAYLYERLGRRGAAEDLYKRMMERYESSAPLIGFYYRMSQVQKRPDYQDKWNDEISEVFPEGLASTPTDDARPERGVIIVKDSELSRKAGLQAGDIVVGLEGLRVQNLHRSYAINSFDEREDMKLTAWRGKLVQISVTAPRRLMGVEFRSYPIAGWSEK